MAVRIAINGFGRIGRGAFKIAFERKGLEVVAINDLTDNETLAHLLKHDTAYGAYEHEVRYDEEHLIVKGKKIPVFAQKDPAELPWDDVKVDVVLECTGKFRREEDASAHLTAGAKRVIISAPAKSESTQTVVLGVNNSGEQKVLSNASCTTNCIAPVAEVIHTSFGIVKAMMTTIHAYTADQNLQDGPHKDLRRARAATQNIVPTTTGAAQATAKVIPDLKGVFDGLAVRVPVITVSLTDFTILVKNKTTVEEVNGALRKAAEHPKYKGILAVTDEPLVSSDFIGNPHSSIVDLALTKVVGGDFVKVVVWYDNEWGYANRLVELAAQIET